MWSQPPEILSLPSQEVHLWRCNLNLDPESVDHCWKILDAAEQQRADRFQFEQHRRRFIVARATLKSLIGKYLKIAATSVQFVLSDRGKPSLAPTIPSGGLRFNLSHSHEQALYGFVCDRNIGVDLEYWRPLKDATQLAQRFFCPREYQAIAQLPVAQQPSAFLQIWTAKEAFLKGIGSGISGGLDRVEILPASSQPMGLSFPEPSDRPLQDWQLFGIDVGHEYHATVAIEAPLGSLRTWQVSFPAQTSA